MYMYTCILVHSFFTCICLFIQLIICLLAWSTQTYSYTNVCVIDKLALGAGRTYLEVSGVRMLGPFQSPRGSAVTLAPDKAHLGGDGLSLWGP